MTLSKLTCGLALLTATACNQTQSAFPVPVQQQAPAIVYQAPQPIQQSYIRPAPVTQQTYRQQPQVNYTVRYRPSQVVSTPQPIQAAPPVVQYQAPVTRSYAAPVPTYTQPAPAYTAPAPRYAAPAPAYAAPAPQIAPASPPSYQPAAVAPPARDVAALNAIRPTRQSAPAIQSRPAGGGRFQVIETPRNVKVAEAVTQQRNPFPRTKPNVSARGTSASNPFSISTRPTGQAYYQGATPPAIEYHIPHLPQEEPLWCWAAAAQQAIGWVNNGRAPAQCAIVALAHGISVEDCCADRDGICAKTGEIPAIAKLVNRFGGEAREMATVPRDPKQIYDILKAGDTLLIRLRPAPHDEAVGIRHMIVVRGIEWLRLPNNQLQATLLYNDPLGEGERAVNFDEIEGFFEQALLVRRKG